MDLLLWHRNFVHFDTFLTQISRSSNKIAGLEVPGSCGQNYLGRSFPSVSLFLAMLCDKYLGGGGGGH